MLQVLKVLIMLLYTPTQRLTFYCYYFDTCKQQVTRGRSGRTPAGSAAYFPQRPHCSLQTKLGWIIDRLVVCTSHCFYPLSTLLFLGAKATFMLCPRRYQEGRTALSSSHRNLISLTSPGASIQNSRAPIDSAVCSSCRRDARTS